MWITLVDMVTGATCRILYGVWRSCLVMAQGAGGWVPAKTRTPHWWPATRTWFDEVQKHNVDRPNPWPGRYLGVDQQQITAADAHALANGIENGMALMPHTIEEAKRLGPFFGNGLIQPGGDEDICRPHQHLWPQEVRPQVAELVAFLRAVPDDGVIELGRRPAVRGQGVVVQP